MPLVIRAAYVTYGTALFARRRFRELSFVRRARTTKRCGGGLRTRRQEPGRRLTSPCVWFVTNRDHALGRREAVAGEAHRGGGDKPLRAPEEGLPRRHQGPDQGRGRRRALGLGRRRRPQGRDGRRSARRIGFQRIPRRPRGRYGPQSRRTATSRRWGRADRPERRLGTWHRHGRLMVRDARFACSSP